MALAEKRLARLDQARQDRWLRDMFKASNMASNLKPPSMNPNRVVSYYALCAGAVAVAPVARMVQLGVLHNRALNLPDPIEIETPLNCVQCGRTKQAAWFDDALYDCENGHRIRTIWCPRCSRKHLVTKVLKNMVINCPVTNEKIFIVGHAWDTVTLIDMKDQ